MNLLNTNYNANIIDFDIKKLGFNEFEITYNDLIYNVIIVNKFENKVEMLINGMLFNYAIDDLGKDLIAKLGLVKKEDAIGNEIKSPMPGLIKDILVKKGDILKKGDAIVILEAMKMENILKCPKDGLTVSEIYVEIGQSVEKSVSLVSF